MSDTFNPFAIGIVLMAIVLIGATALGVAAPALGVSKNLIPVAPKFPNFPDLNGQGNQTAATGGGWAFNQTGYPYYKAGQTWEFHYDDFHPSKMVKVYTPGSGMVFFEIMRFGTWAVIPWWYSEPMSYVNGSDVPKTFGSILGLNVQQIINNWNGSGSYYIIDYGNNQYEAYVKFSPLPGYWNSTDTKNGLVASWNIARGFTVTMYGNSYAPPSWTDQLVAAFTFLGGIVGYFLYFVVYIIQLSGTAFAIFGVSVAVGEGVVMLVTLVLAGSFLMYIRGYGGGGK